MRKRIICIIMLTIILISALNLASVLTLSFAESSILGEDSLEKIDRTTLLNKADELNQTIGIDANQGSIDGKPYAKQTSNTKTSYANWNFSNTSEWSKSAYLDGNKTRLIIGVDGEKPTSLVELEKIVAKHKGEIVNTISIGSNIRAVVVELSLVSVTTFTEEIGGAGLASYVEPNMKVQAQFVPNDVFWSNQWGPQKIEADWAWNITMGSYDVLVAVVDTGIDYSHPDLVANYVPLGYDWVSNDADPIDDFGHGTHCAGIIAATLNNSVGIAGLAQVQIMAEKVLDSGGWGYWDWVANGIIHATNSGADIISMSLGGYGYSELVHEAVKYAYDAGVLVIAAAGNDNTNMKSYPAAYDEVIAVAATDRDDSKAYFSNWGDWIELAAPGVDIISTMPTYHVTLNDWGYAMYYDFLSGTSMACPHVAGMAALVCSLYPNKTRDWVRLWLRYTADDLGDLGFDVYYGYGRVNARKAVEQTPPEHELIAYDWRTPPYVEPGETGTINASILNFGEDTETDITIELLVNQTIVDSTFIGFMASGNLTTVSLFWNPMLEGLYNITLYIVPVLDEISVENNVLSKYVYVGFPLKAFVLHSAGNIYSDIITNWQVLNNEWYQFGDTMIYIDYTTLNKDGITYEDIVSTEADVLIISCAYDPWMGWQFTDYEIEAIKRYVYEGHGLIATAGTLYYQVPGNNKLAPLFGLNEATMWTGTGTDLLHLLNTTHPLLRNVPNPFVFPDVGTAIPFDKRWDSNELVGGKYLALGHYRESAIVTYRGLVYISPWLEIIPPYYHHHLQLLYNAITWSRYQKPQHELVVSIEAPKRVNPGEPTLLNATVFNKGLSEETDVELQLFINSVLVDSVNIPALTVDSSYMLSHLWIPAAQGIYNVTACAPPILGEEFTENNIVEKNVLALTVSVRNVLVYADDYVVALASRYVIAALNNLEINYTYYADDPTGFGSALITQHWDLVIVDHCNYYAMGYYWTELDEYVRNGGRLVLSTFDIDGSDSEPTTLWDTLGVRWVSDMFWPEPVYRWMPSHSIFTSPNSIGDLTSYMEGYLDNGDHVAATTGTAIAGFQTSPTQDFAGIVVGNIYQTVLFSFVLDEFRYDQDGDGELDAIELWENAIVYLARSYDHDLAVTLDAPKVLKPNQPTLLNATVCNRGLSNETNVELQLMINGAIVDSAVIPELLTEASYTLSYSWIPTTEGTYNVTAYAPSLLNEELIGNNRRIKLVDVYRMMVAVVLDSYGTDYAGSTFWDYLNTNWATYGAMRIAIDYKSLNKENITLQDIESTYADVLIISNAWSDTNNYGWEFTDSEIEAIKTYMLAGHGIIATAGTFDTWSAPNNQKLAELFGMNQNVSYNWGYDGDEKTTNGIFNLRTPSHSELWRNIPDPYYAEIQPTLNPIPSCDWTIQGVTTGWIEALSIDRYAAVITNEVIHRAVYFTCCLELFGQYNENNRQLFYNAIVWASLRKYKHDLAVYLEAPLYLEVENSVLLNATVRNEGLNNETSVELYLLINSTIVRSAAIPELQVDKSHTINYAWTPTKTGNYNITAYALLVPEEEYTANNLVTKSVHVFFYARFYLPHEWVGSGDPMGYHADEGVWSYGLPFDFPFYGVYYRTIYISSNGLISFITQDASYSNSIPALAQRLAIAPAWDDWVTYVPYDVYIWQNSTHIGIRWYAQAFGSNSLANFEAILRADGVIQLNYDYNNGPVSATIGISNGVGHILAEDITDLNYTNTIVFMPFQMEHELAVTLETPTTLEIGTSVLLNVIVYNNGISNEANVRLQLLINDTIVNSTVIPELPIGESCTLNHLWTPSVQGTYNITAYTPRITGEILWTNNIATRSVLVVRFVGTYLIVNPTASRLLPGETLTINISVVNAADLYCWQIRLYHDPLVLRWLDATYPSGHIFDGKEYLAVPPTNGTDEVGTYVMLYAGLLGEQPGFTGDGILCQMSFKAVNTGVSELRFSRPLGWEGDTWLCDRDLNSIPFRALDGIAEVTRPPDVAIINVALMITEAYKKWMIPINVTAKNQGDATETFTVTLYYGNTTIETQTITLGADENITLTFNWNTTYVPLYINYTIWAEASTVLGEVNTDNNVLIGGTVIVKMMGDVNGDKKVDGKDLALLTKAFGSDPNSGRWIPEADLNRDEKIDGKDIAIYAKAFASKDL